MIAMVVLDWAVMVLITVKCYKKEKRTSVDQASVSLTCSLIKLELEWAVIHKTRNP